MLMLAVPANVGSLVICLVGADANKGCRRMIMYLFLTDLESQTKVSIVKDWKTIDSLGRSLPIKMSHN